MEEYSEHPEERITFDIPPQRSHSNTPKNISIVTYCGNSEAFANVQEPFARDVAADSFIWRRSYGKSKEIFCHLQFVKYAEAIKNSDLGEALLGPVLHSFWCDGQFADSHKPNIRDQLTAWLEDLELQNIGDWIIVVLVRPDSKKSPRSKPVPRLEFYDRINAEFCWKVRDRGRCIYLWDPRSGMGDADVWHTAVLRFRQLISDGYEVKLKSFEEHVRIAREERARPDWKLTTYFCSREALANAYQRLDFPEEALFHLDDLDQVITQFVADAAQEMPTSPHRLQCCVVPKTWLGPTFALRAKDNWRLHQLVDSGNASLLEMRNFLFARQFDLMQETNRTSEFSMRAIPFIQNVNQECKLFDVKLIPGALDCWTFLSCHDIRQTAQNCGDASTPLILQNCATLLGLERETLARLGNLCGLMPNQTVTSAQQALTDVLSATIEGLRPSSAVVKLYDSLLSREKFVKNYLELCEMAMGTFKHVGRTRAARQLGIDLAKCYMKWNLYDKAAGFLFDALKVLKDERWLLLSADVAMLYAQCTLETEQWDQVIKAALLVVSCLQVDMEVRLKHFRLFQETVLTEQSRKLETTIVGGGNLFIASALQPSWSDSIHLFVDQHHNFSIFLDVNLPIPVSVKKCTLYLKRNKAGAGRNRSSLRRHPSNATWETDRLRIGRPGSRSNDAYLPCNTSIPKDSFGGSGDASVNLKHFPGVKFGDADKGRLSPAKSPIQEDVEPGDEAETDIFVVGDLDQLIPGRNLLTFPLTLSVPGFYRASLLRILYSDDFQFAVPVGALPMIEVLAEMPDVRVEPVSSYEPKWTTLSYAFRIILSGGDFLGDIPVSISIRDPEIAQLTDVQSKTLPLKNSLLRMQQHEIVFHLKCTSPYQDYTAVISLALPWTAIPLNFSFPFLSFLKLSTSAHFCPSGTFITAAVSNRWRNALHVQGSTLTLDDKPLEALTKAWSMFMIKPKEVVRLIWKAADITSLPVLCSLSLRYSVENDPESMQTCRSDFAVGVSGQMRIRIILAAPLLNIMQIYMGEPLHVEYRLHAQEMSGGSLTSLYYQLKYDTSFWSSTDEASGPLEFNDNKTLTVRCSVVGMKHGSVALPVMRLFYLKDEDIIPVDQFHVYNESTCRTIHIVTKPSPSNSIVTTV